MFERFTDPVTVVRMIQQGDLDRLKRVISGGARIDRRTPLDPWMTPLDAACAAGSVAAVDLLINAGVAIYGSSIYEAIKTDSLDILKRFQAHDAKFHLRFQQEANNQHNPKLNRWLSNFTALDFAISVGASRCITFLTEIGARRHPTTKPHLKGCTGILIEDESFIAKGGVNVDGLTEVTTGFYCAKCERFVR
jgi:hypothetical protein